MMNKKGLSPLIATLLLVVFALVLGAAIMSLGKSYINGMNEEESHAPEISDKVSATLTINLKTLNDPLKFLQIQYITDEITKEEYLTQEKELIE